MTTKEYIETVKQKYPNTYIGLDSYYKQQNSNIKDFASTYNVVPLDYIITLIIKYLEYRQIDILTALCNYAVDNLTDTHDIIRMKAITNVIHRLEKHIIPAEGQPF